MSTLRSTLAQQESLLAANGLTSAAIASWNPSLLRTPRVLVPIEVEALMVRDPSQAWACTQFQTPPQSPPADPTPAALLRAPLFTPLPAPRPRGAYLQWYLPRGLTSASGDANGLPFPPIPDRWLVLRLSAGSTPARRAVAAWVLQADVEPPTVTELAAWSEPGSSAIAGRALNALGHGDLAWAGYFDNVVNRLGFYDSLVDDRTKERVLGPVSYLVCGWYADPSADPLGNATIDSLAAFNAKMDALGWSLDLGQLNEVVLERQGQVEVLRALGLPFADPRPAADYTTDGSWWPAAVVLHGAVVDIAWPQEAGSAGEAGGPPNAATVAVATGESMAETLAALVVQSTGNPQTAAIVAAMQLGVLDELDKADGRAQLDVQLHGATFASQADTSYATEPLTIAPSGPAPSSPSGLGAPGPGIFARKVNPFGSIGDPGIFDNPLAGHSFAAKVPVPVGVLSGHSPGVVVERPVPSGLSSILTQLGAGVALSAGDPGGVFDVKRARPRFYTPKDPVVLIQGAKRAFTHDSTVKTENGTLVCRLTPVSELSWTMPGLAERLFLRGDDVLEGGIGNGSVPLECEGLLRELVLLDPGSSAAIAANAAALRGSGFDVGTAQLHVAVEQTAWYALRNPRIDPAPLLASSGIRGMLPAAFSIAPVQHPWTPIELQWQVEYLPSPGGEADWQLDEIDFVMTSSASVPAPGTGTLFSGRSTLTGGASAQIASAVRNAYDQATRIGDSAPVPAAGIEQHFSALAQSVSLQMRELSLNAPGSGPPGTGTDPGLLDDIATALDNMDVLSCGLNGILAALRGGSPADGAALLAEGATTPFFASRAGFLRIARLRLVDGFGQFVDLCGSSDTTPAQGYLVADSTAVPGYSGLLAQPPRFSAPARARFRFMSADQAGVEADYQTSPVCGFVMPNHLDGSLEFFNTDGSGAGSLQPDPSGVLCWLGAPGLPSSAGQSPASGLSNGYAAELAQGLLDWGVADAGQSGEGALSSLLRVIDSTLWTVDPFAHQGEEHLALLVGHPVCVMRAMICVDLLDPVVSADGTVLKVPVRLGNLTHWQDGLLGYFVNDDYSTVWLGDTAAAGLARQPGPGQGFLSQIDQVPGIAGTFAEDVAGNVGAPAASPGASPVSHAYVSKSDILWIPPNQVVNLTLLVEPYCTVHATAGRVPRKEIGMRRAWVHAGLAAIAPTFRFGPVLVDPKQIRMPIASDIQGNWVWDYRSDAASWTEKAVVNATDDALLSADPPLGIEGWLKLAPPGSSSG